MFALSPQPCSWIYCYNSLHSLGKAYHFWNLAAGICSHLATRALVRSGTDVGPKKLDWSLRFNKSWRSWRKNVEVKALCRPDKFFHTKIEKRCILHTLLCIHRYCNWSILFCFVYFLSQSCTIAHSYLQYHCMLHVMISLCWKLKA